METQMKETTRPSFVRRARHASRDSRDDSRRWHPAAVRENFARRRRECVLLPPPVLRGRAGEGVYSIDVIRRSPLPTLPRSTGAGKNIAPTKVSSIARRQL